MGKTSSSSKKKETSNLRIPIIAAISTAIVGSALYFFISKNDNSNVDNNNAKVQEILKPEIVAEEKTALYPKIVIPNTPGNVKELLTILAQKSGLSIDWKLKGHYNLNAEEITQFNNPISLVLTPLTDLMTLNNKELSIKWKLGNPKEPFPYPVFVTTLICGKTIMLFELADPTQIQILLDRPDFKHCSKPANGILSPADFIDYSQFDFSKAPPFLQPYDATQANAQNTPVAVDGAPIITPKLDPKFTANNAIPQQQWTLPANNQPIDYKPEMINQPLTGASSQ